MESEGCVYLAHRLDTYLARKCKLTLSFMREMPSEQTGSDFAICLHEFHNASLEKKLMSQPIPPSDLPIDYEILERSAATSSSSMSTVSDDDSPVFHRRQKVTFVDIQTVASSSVRYEQRFEFSTREIEFSSNAKKAILFSIRLASWIDGQKHNRLFYL